MGLLMDKRTSRLWDWLEYDSKLMILLEGNHTEILAKSRLAQEIVESEVLELLIQQFQESPGAARTQLKKIVVGSELRRWHAFKTLELFYGDLAAISVNAPHAEQAKKFSVLANQARSHFLSTGIGYVNDPLPAPKVPVVQAVESPGIPRVLRGCIAYSSNSGDFSGASELFVLDVSASHSFRVGPVVLPSAASGWNLYIGADERTLKLANQNPLIGEETIVVTADLPQSGSPTAPEFGQKAQSFWLADKAIWR